MAKVSVEIDLDEIDDDDIYDEADKRGLLIPDGDGALSDHCEHVADELNRLDPAKRDAVYEAMRNCEYGRIGLLVE